MVKEFYNLNDIFEKENKPDFNNLLAILRGDIPKRSTLFEFSINQTLCEKISDINFNHDLHNFLTNIYTFRNAGYDFCPILLPDFLFPTDHIEVKKTKSLNQGALIRDLEFFEIYRWPDPNSIDYSLLDQLVPDIPDGMKLMVFSPDGVLENAIKLIGFNNLCLMLYENPNLVQVVFQEIGSRLTTYYKNCLRYDIVGAILCNDDWGFKTQTFFSRSHLQEYVFPWYKEIVSIAHQTDKPAVLHSCDNLELIMEDIINEMEFDGKHSFEDSIQPVEDAYFQYHDRITILGGIDFDFLCNASESQIYKRSKEMIKVANASGRYALGTGYIGPHKLYHELN